MVFNLRFFPFVIAASLLLTWPHPAAHAFMTVQESNEITPLGRYKVGVEPQIRTSNGSGFNLTGFFDAPVNDETSIRAMLGTGETELMVGGSGKWVPIPDYDRQPALGLKGSVVIWRKSSESYFTYRVDPLASKKFDTDRGVFVPYASLPVMLTTGDGKTTTGIQLALGSELYHPDTPNMTYGLELGTSLKDSFSYISGYVTIYLDEFKTRTNH